jgi:hypothetical protein
LQAHGSFRQGADQSLQHQLRPISVIVAGVVGVNAAYPVSGDEGPVELDQQIVGKITDFQLLAQRWLS